MTRHDGQRDRRSRRSRALYVLDPDAFQQVYGERERAQIEQLVEVVAPPQTATTVLDNPDVLSGVEVILSGWGVPVMDEGFLVAAGDLRVVFHGAGSIRRFVTDAFWERRIRVTSAAAANAMPVSEYTLAVILFSLKHGWRLARTTRAEQRFPSDIDVPGCYGTTVGLVSLGRVGRLVLDRLNPFEMRVIAHDPDISTSEARMLGVELVTIEELFSRSDVVSVHAPLLEETTGLITGSHVASMKHGATLINTARGAIVRERELVDVLARRSDLQAVLDVTDPEPPPPGSRLYRLPNVVVTPHIAGSVGQECQRLGAHVVEELARWVADETLRWEITRTEAIRQA